jgi:hypothetical protein
VKPSDESVVSSTTLQDDDALIVNVQPGTKYRVRGTLFLDETDSGLKIAIGGTATVTAMKVQILIYDTQLRASGRVTALGSDVSHGTTGGGLHYVVVDGVIEVNAAGTLLIQWAQNTSDPVALVMQKDSFFEATPAV